MENDGEHQIENDRCELQTENDSHGYMENNSVLQMFLGLR